jgi:hypothetical protein
VWLFSVNFAPALRTLRLKSFAARAAIKQLLTAENAEAPRSSPREYPSGQRDSEPAVSLFLEFRPVARGCSFF